ncbi:MAG TPA: DUF924 family protein [Trinickia sp.]|jgi:uncharacterized protein (DUF924 family)|nr:DUF924 family protein [Trinickia sp.]
MNDGNDGSDANQAHDAHEALRAGDAARSAAEYTALDPAARDVLDFWFGEPGSVRFGKRSKRWFAGDAALDRTVRERFGATLVAACRGDCDDWQRSPLGALALVIVFDQFSRNAYRGSADAFAGDARALDVAREMVATGADLRLPTLYHRAFAYMPFEHDESLAAQRESVRLFEALAREAGPRDFLDSARRHAQVIERFGRYPHRNAALGRASTDEEIAFLREPGSSF